MRRLSLRKDKKNIKFSSQQKTLIKAAVLSTIYLVVAFSRAKQQVDLEASVEDPCFCYRDMPFGAPMRDYNNKLIEQDFTLHIEALRGRYEYPEDIPECSLP